MAAKLAGNKVATIDFLSRQASTMLEASSERVPWIRRGSIDQMRATLMPHRLPSTAGMQYHVAVAVAVA